MIAVQIGPDMRMAVVGAPSYFKKKPEPKSPQDLIGHNCINLRLLSHGGLYAWEFEKGGRELRVRVEVSSPSTPRLRCSMQRLPEQAWPMCRKAWCNAIWRAGRLKRVLEDWCLPYSGYHLFYPSRRQSSAAFALVVNALRYRN
jgi:DNA-binding transcriptional LysR family regulator